VATDHQDGSQGSPPGSPEPHPPALSLTLVACKRARKLTPAILTIAELQARFRHRVGEKDGPAFIPAIFSRHDQGRKNEFVDRVTALTFDLEHLGASDLPSILDRIRHFALVYTTFSHTPEKPRIRIVIPLLRPITPDEHGRLWRHLAQLLGPSVDQACKDASRLFFFPRVPDEAALTSAWTKTLDGDWLDPDQFLAEIRSTDDRSSAHEDGDETLLRTPPPARPSPALDATEDEEDKPDLQPILDGCSWLRHCIEGASTLSEPEWYGALSIIARARNGRDAAHDASRPYPGYDPVETNQKIDHALSAAGPRTCRNIRRSLGGETRCSACDHWGFIKSPIVLGLPSTAVRTWSVVLSTLETITEDNGEVAFEPSFLRAAARLKHRDKRKYVKLRRELKKRKVPIRDWTTAVQAEVRGLRKSRRDASGRKLPTIHVNGVALPIKVKKAWRAIMRWNEPTPQLFLRSDTIARLVRPGAAPLCLRDVSETEVFGHLARAANWVHGGEKGDVPVHPDRDVCKDMMAFPRKNLPPLERIINCPIFTREGILIQTLGYHRQHALYFDSHDAVVVDVPPVPSPEDVAWARWFLTEELLSDFPFVDESDRTHFIGALILHFVRDFIDGCTPIHAIDAPTPGTGKGLLCSIVHLVATGQGAKAQIIPNDDDEFRKRITSMLERGPAVVHLDNVHRLVDSAALSAVTTAEFWTDRRLGHTQMITARNRATWLLTGNNLRLSGEIARRCVRIRLDAGCAEPWKRTEFRHADLQGWVRKNRSEIVRAILVLASNWIAKGKPGYPRRIGSFETWSDVIGGILSVAGFPGFLAVDLESEESVEWQRFAAAWYEHHGSEPRRVNELLSLSQNLGLLHEVRGEGSDQSQVTRLGRALGARQRCVLGSYRLELAEDGGHKGKRYALVPLEPPTTDSDGDARPGEEPAVEPSPAGESQSDGPTPDRGATSESPGEQERSGAAPPDSHPVVSEPPRGGAEAPQAPRSPVTDNGLSTSDGEPRQPEAPQRLPEGSPAQGNLFEDLPGFADPDESTLPGAKP